MSANRSSGPWQTLSTGGIHIAVSRTGAGVLVPSLEQASFLATAETAADIRLSVSLEPRSPRIRGRLVFDTGQLWTLYATKHARYFRSLSASVRAIPHQVAVLDPDLSSGQVVFDGRAWPSGAEALPLLHHPLDTFLVIHYLPRCFGALIHACGVDDRGRGQMFVGASHAGKSTTGLLWHQAPGATVLSDDRVVIRKHDRDWWMYGTPWAGDANLASPTRVPLERVFFLTQAASNYVRDIPPLEAVTRLLRCCFTTHWDRERMALTLEVLDALSRELPCYELGFKPDPSTVDFVRGHRRPGLRPGSPGWPPGASCRPRTGVTQGGRPSAVGGH